MPVDGRRATLGAVIACAAQFLVGADGLAVAIALPSLQRDLGVSPIDGQWVLTAYGPRVRRQPAARRAARGPLRPPPPAGGGDGPLRRRLARRGHRPGA